MTDGPQRDEGGSLARASGELFAARLVASLGFLVVVVVLSRSLGPSGRGVLAFVTVAALLVAKIAEVGLGAAAVFFAARRPRERAALLTTQLAFVVSSTAVLMGAIATLLLIVPGARPDGLDETLLVLLVPATVLTAVTEWSLAFLLGARRTRAQAIGTVVGPWLYAGALGIVSLVTELDVVSAAVAWVIGYLAWSIALVGLSVRAVGLARPSRAMLSESLGFGLRALGGGLARTLNARFDQLLLAYLSTQAALGVYAVAVNASEVLLYLPAAIAMAFAPAAAVTSHDERSGRTLRALRVALLLTAASLVPSLILGPLLIPAVFGKAFSDSVTPFLVLVPGAIGYVLLRIFSAALLGSSLPGRASAAALASLGSGIALVVILAPPFGATGAAVAATAALWLGGIVAAGLYRASAPFEVRELVPRRADVHLVAERARSLGSRRHR